MVADNTSRDVFVETTLVEAISEAGYKRGGNPQVLLR
jgi:hypothetical protein